MRARPWLARAAFGSLPMVCGSRRRSARSASVWNAWFPCVPGDLRALEAAPGFEPGMTDLQSVALPLGYAAPLGCRRDAAREAPAATGPDEYRRAGSAVKDWAGTRRDGGAIPGAAGAPE